ncbi:MAG: hypothetical protein ABI345_09020 [Jatrophihabitans sp.]
MSSSLSNIPIHKRRQLAATLGLFSVLFIAVGAVAATGAGTAVVRTFVIVALAVAIVLALMGWGVTCSVRADLAESRLDAAIEDAVAAQGGIPCGCGHDHDPSVLHVPDDPCDRDGHGSGCTHSCTTCVLATLRRPAGESAPTAELVGSRPSPRPRPITDEQQRPSPSR